MRLSVCMLDLVLLFEVLFLIVFFFVFFFKQKTAYEMRISDWSSDVCSSDLAAGGADLRRLASDADRARARARLADRAGHAGLLRRRRRPRRAVNAAAADSDRLTRFLLDRAGVRGVRVHLGDSWTQIREQIGRAHV